MAKIDRVRVAPPQPRSDQVGTILAAIPKDRRRDRVLFRLIAETGLRPGEALGLFVEDLDLTPDDKHISVVGKGGRRRTILLDDDPLVAPLRSYLRYTGYRHGPLSSGLRNGRGGPLR